MTPDLAIALACALALCAILGVLLVSGRRHDFHHQKGWWLVVGGFGLLLLGSFADVAAGLHDLSRPESAGETLGQSLAPSLAVYLAGLALLVVGFLRWLPQAGELRDSVRRLSDHAVALEAEVAAREAGMDEANRELRESEERFRGVVENSPSAIFLKDLEGQFRLVNQRFTEWYGVAAEDALGKTSHEIFPNVYADAYVSQDQEVLALGKVVEREQDIVFQDGGTHTILVTKFPVMGENRVPLGIGTINTDLTEHKRALNALQESETALAEAQKVAKVGNWRWSVADDVLISCSQEFARLHGMSALEAQGTSRQKLESLIHPDDRETAAEVRDRSTASGADYQIEYRIVGPDGERHVLTIAKACLDSAGRVSEYTGTVQDVTEQKRAEAALLAAKEEAELASRAKTEFLANMSHELRTPLNWIIGFAELIKNEMLGPIGEAKYREYVEDIHSGGLHLLDLINDLLDLAQIESGNARIQESKIDLLDLIPSCVKLMTERANSAGVELRLEVPAKERPQLYADPRMLKQILINLMSNGVKFTPDGGSVTVKCWLSPDREFLLQVRDTGIGIAPKDIPKALGRFQQVESQLNRTTEGSGLGLALTKSFVELHEGSLDLESALGEGTVVTVRFPAGRVLPDPGDQELEPPLEPPLAELA